LHIFRRRPFPLPPSRDPSQQLLRRETPTCRGLINRARAQAKHERRESDGYGVRRGARVLRAAIRPRVSNHGCGWVSSPPQRRGGRSRGLSLSLSNDLSNNPAATGVSVGIDFGTTFCAVGVLHDGKPKKILPNEDGYRTTPSHVAFDGDVILIGKPAKTQVFCGFVQHRVWRRATDRSVDRRAVGRARQGTSAGLSKGPRQGPRARPRSSSVAAVPRNASPLSTFRPSFCQRDRTLPGPA
jgi:hypothetical protein